MSVLITGAAGFAGSHLIDLFAADGVEMTAWHRPGGRAPAARLGVTWEAVDLLDRAQVAAAVTRRPPSAVYHCAGEAHVGRAWDHTASTFAINVRGTHFLIDALRAAGRRVPMFVPSSAMTYRPADVPLTESHPQVPASPYGVSKLAQELLAVRAVSDGVDACIARAFNHVGPRQDPSFAASGFAKQIAEMESGVRAPEIVVGNLQARREITDVRDTVRAYRAILERGRPGRPYNVCSGRAIPIAEVVDRVVAQARVRVTVRVDPARFRPNDLPLVEGDPTRMREELGWTPRIPLDDTLRTLLDYWRSVIQSPAAR